MQLGTAISIIRRALGLKQSDIAKKAKVSTAFFSLVESGDKHPSIPTLRRIAGALEIPPEVLISLASGEINIAMPDPRSKTLAATIQEMARLEGELRSRLQGRGIDES